MTTRAQQPRQPARGGRTAAPAVAAAAASLAALLLAPAPPEAADLLGDLAGRWATAPGAAGPALAMEWSPRDGGFALAWSGDGGEARETFAPAEGRPGLFFPERHEGGWSMFGGDEEPENPLLDGPLFWARADAGTVYVYRVEIDAKGAYVIERYACRLAEAQKLDVGLLRRLPGGRAEESRMLLTKELAP